MIAALRNLARAGTATIRSRFALSASAAVAVLAAVGVISQSGGVEPLEPAEPEESYLGVSMTDRRFTVSSLYLRHPGKDITVLSVEPLTSPNIEYLGSFVVWPRDFRTHALTAGRGFPSPLMPNRHPLGELVPASETAYLELSDRNGNPAPVFVAAGFRLASGDIGAVNGIRVTYDLDGKTKRETFRYAAIVCLPDCADRPDWDTRKFEDNTLRRFGLLPT
ncbi:MAG: hypothetical protein ACT4PP_12045 [Sporichthyaceae bacterium]